MTAKRARHNGLALLILCILQVAYGSFGEMERFGSDENRRVIEGATENVRVMIGPKHVAT